ncbi:MAG: hypothetical protein GWO44_16190, partial [Thermoplasmata archaeon]|nr:hypothetical protein [Thermoplasmata archaeon]NIY04743.1 hypothetical protein [Thermoplasmata archaeon]
TVYAPQAAIEAKLSEVYGSGEEDLISGDDDSVISEALQEIDIEEGPGRDEDDPAVEAARAESASSP